MTYFFFLLGAILLFRGLVGERGGCLVLAGVALGMNVYVRNPNICEVALIVCLWYYGVLRHKSGKQIMRETLLCVAGYLGAIAVMTVIMMIHYGANAPLEMISGLFAVAGRASDYTLLQMLATIADAYLHGFRWLIYLILATLAGMAFLMIRPQWLVRTKAAVYCIGIVLLMFILYRWGMFNFKYYQKEAALQWAVILLILAMVNMIRLLLSKAADVHWKLIAAIGVVVVLITPLGSNNHVWPIINNLFFIAPIILWLAYKSARWGKLYSKGMNLSLPLFPVKAMQVAIMIVVLIQSLGVGIFYTFNDGETGTPKDTVITGNSIAQGMYTTGINASNLEELSAFIDNNRAWQQQKEQRLILYGNIPGLSYYLDRATAIFTAWPDLDSSSAELLASDLTGLTAQIMAGGDRPMVIINAQLSDVQRSDAKKGLIDRFIQENGYNEVFRNEQFIAWL
jgi:hypothetical protein